MILILQMARPKLLEVEAHTQFPGDIHDLSVHTGGHSTVLYLRLTLPCGLLRPFPHPRKSGSRPFPLGLALRR